jgi:hypothetical protein
LSADRDGLVPRARSGETVESRDTIHAFLIFARSVLSPCPTLDRFAAPIDWIWESALDWEHLPALLADALSEPVYVTVDGKRRRITKREAVIHQLVNKSAGADWRATKMLFDMMKDAERQAGFGEPPTTPPEAPAFDRTDEEVVKSLYARIRRDILAEIAEKNTEGPIAENPDDDDARLV